ncbi:hypothetical protein GFL39_11395 [Rhizobium leguminosarum bv. viciae]|nr:hypothetical protein [Rhizobium leguminosarum bv. viciae]NKM19789.1 hypothetical protein [Rhizobium laguerreae]NKL82154.1 hypothetical protein [Rhizobium leguminosarum bv. viciae]NKL91612.1 hypothetical protein [Rhizobium leguminosarum bv. viciae]NKM29082.1 hypothetical protein [Rhizobium laguerreae]
MAGFADRRVGGMKAGDDLQHWGVAVGIGYDFYDRISTVAGLTTPRQPMGRYRQRPPSLKKT